MVGQIDDKIVIDKFLLIVKFAIISKKKEKKEKNRYKSLL